MKKAPIVEIILVILASLLYFAANLQRVAVPGAVFTLLQNDLQPTAQSIASLGSYFMYVYAASQLVIGILIARYGGFKVITLGSILFFAGSLLFPVAQTLPLLYFSRVLIGVGSASFYLSLIAETKKIVPHKNFGVILSIVLLVGFLGGIVANAPLVVCIDKLGWRETFWITGVATAVIAILFIAISKFADKEPEDKTVKFDFSTFKSVFSDRRNNVLYTFSFINYGLYYVIQTVIGKKFLEDFCMITNIKAATVLSVMGALYAFAGSIIAIMSKAAVSRRVIFLKIASFNTFFSFAIILACLFVDFKDPIIPSLLFCSLSFWGSLSPLLVPLLHDINNPKIAGTAVSILTCGFCVTVGILGNVVGFCLDLFRNHQTLNLPMFHGNGAYIAIFSFGLMLAVIALINVFKIEESQKTKRILAHLRYLENVQLEREGKIEDLRHHSYHI